MADVLAFNAPKKERVPLTDEQMVDRLLRVAGALRSARWPSSYLLDVLEVAVELERTDEQCDAVTDLANEIVAECRAERGAATAVLEDRGVCRG